MAVRLLPRGLDQRAVQRVFEKGVLENVRAPAGPALRVQDLRLSELGQLRLQRRLVHVRNGGEQFVAELTADDGGELGQVPATVQSVEIGRASCRKRG